MIDDSYDSDFPAPHLDPSEQNDIKYVGEDKPVVEHHHADSEIELVDENGNLTFGEIPF